MGLAATSPENRSARKPAQASWLRSPQRVWLRKALFQIHLWVGIALALYAVAIGLSGSALVFRDEIERQMWPAAFHVTPEPRPAAIAAALERIERDRQGWVLVALRDFSVPGRAPTALMRPAAGKVSANWRQVSFNPYTGQVLLDRLRYDGWLGWLANLHEYLLASEPGLQVSGWMAVGMLTLCLTGVVLWWPGVARWVSALAIHPRARWKRLNWELHAVVGFWTSAALIAVTFTGIEFAFPDAVGNAVELATGGSLRVREALSNPRMEAPSASAAAVMSVDQAIAAVAAALPREAPAGYLQLPAKRSGPAVYRATGYYTGSLPYSQLVRVAIDARTGKVLAYSDTRNDTLGMRVQQYFTTVHFGSFGGDGALGVAVKWLWVLVGIAPALLAVTGLIMYWNRKLRPAWLRMRRRRA